MKNTVSKKHNKYLKKVKNVAKDILSDLVEEIIYRGADVKIKSIDIVPETEVKNIFSRYSRWDLQYEVSWSKYFLEEINRGFSGLIIEGGLKPVNSPDPNMIVAYCKFSSFIVDLLKKDEKIKDIFYQKAMHDLTEMRENSIYRFEEISEFDIEFVYDNDRGIFTPEIIMVIKVYRIN